MSSTTAREAMFSLTPPPSELDEFDKTTLLACSPVLSGLCYPSPAPSHRAHADSVSSESIFLDNDMSFPSDDKNQNPHQDQHHMFFGDTTSDASFYPISTLSTDSDMAAPYATASDYPQHMYPHNQWLPFSTYAQPASLPLSYEGNATALFPNYESSMPPSLTNIIPPTPQDITPGNFSFNSPPTQSMYGSLHQSLVNSPSFSQLSRHTSHSSVSSLSRSTSPNPSLYQPTTSSSTSHSLRPTLRSNSTSSTTSLHAYGIPVSPRPTQGMSSHRNSPPQPPTWRCAYPGCTSRATFTRGCDLRKHYNRHSKHLFCRVDGCPQSEAAIRAKQNDPSAPLTGGFSSKKDRARHEAKHNPGIRCEWRGPDGEDCGRVFSRMDNMKDHVRRIHKKGETTQHSGSKSKN